MLRRFLALLAAVITVTTTAGCGTFDAIPVPPSSSVVPTSATEKSMIEELKRQNFRSVWMEKGITLDRAVHRTWWVNDNQEELQTETDTLTGATIIALVRAHVDTTVARVLQCVVGDEEELRTSVSKSLEALQNDVDAFEKDPRITEIPGSDQTPSTALDCIAVTPV